MSIGSYGRAWFRFVDLFAGMGGFRLALESLGGRCVMSSEIERHARATYHMNFGVWPRGDVRTIRGEDVPEHEILCGGFPCQAFSISGLRRGFADEVRGTLFFEIARLLKAKRPAVAFLENVPNLKAHDGGRTFATILRVLHECGYEVHHRVLNASEFGAPTARKRIYIVAFRTDLNVGGFLFPEPTRKPICLADVLEPASLRTQCLVTQRKDIHLDIEAEAQARASRPLETVPVGGFGDKPYRQGYRIYSAHGHAVTLMARGGGMGAKCGYYLVDGVVRRLLPRECLGAMGYPQDFTIPPSVSPEQFRALVGNSIVVSVVRLIAERILASLGLPPAGDSSAHSIT